MRHLKALVKAAASVALLWFVFSRVDVGDLYAHLQARDILLALLAGTFVLSTQAALAALRFQKCARIVGHRLHLFPSWVACQYGGFFSHTPISFVGGDAMRTWHLVSGGIPIGDAVKVVIIDRAIGFIGMMVLVALTLPALQRGISDPVLWTGVLIFIGIGLIAVTVFILLGKARSFRSRKGVFGLLAEYASLSSYLAAYPGQTLRAFAIAFVMNLLNPFAVWLIAAAYGGGVSIAIAFVAAPIVFLIAMIPISVAGWGLREGAFVVAFGLFGISSAAALSASVTFGVALLLAYLPAPYLFVSARRRGLLARTPQGVDGARAARGVDR